MRCGLGSLFIASEVSRRFTRNNADRKDSSSFTVQASTHIQRHPPVAPGLRFSDPILSLTARRLAFASDGAANELLAPASNLQCRASRDRLIRGRREYRSSEIC